MHEVRFGSRHPLHYLLALFSSSRTQPTAEEKPETTQWLWSQERMEEQRRKI